LELYLVLFIILEYAGTLCCSKYMSFDIQATWGRNSPLGNFSYQGAQKVFMFIH